MAKLSIEEIIQIVDHKGLDCAITDYISGKDIKDQELAKLWSEATEILHQIEDILWESNGR